MFQTSIFNYKPTHRSPLFQLKLQAPTPRLSLTLTPTLTRQCQCQNQIQPSYSLALSCSSLLYLPPPPTMLQNTPPLSLNSPKKLPSSTVPLTANLSTCSDDVVHIAMTLDTTYNTLPARKISCTSSVPLTLPFSVLPSPIPSLIFNFSNDFTVSGPNSTPIRSAPDCPLNYARRYLSNLLPLCVRRVVYLDSDLLLVDDIAKLATTPLEQSNKMRAN